MADPDMSDRRRYELEKLAEKSTVIAVLLGFLLGPLGYVYVGSWRLAVINLVTLNYVLLGFVIVPIHTYTMIHGARDEIYGDDRDRGRGRSRDDGPSATNQQSSWP